MGTFGSESYSNDTVWDWLGAAGEEVKIHEMTEEQIAEALRLFLEKHPEPLHKRKYDDDRQTFLGMVVWCLYDGLTISEKYLRIAEKCAQDLLADKEHLAPWKDEAERLNCLIREYREVRYALTHLGKSQDKPYSPVSKKWQDRDFPVYVPIISTNDIITEKGRGEHIKAQLDKHLPALEQLFNEKIGPQILRNRYDGHLFKVTVNFDTQHITEDEWDRIARENFIDTVPCKICKHNAVKEKAIPVGDEYVGYECCRKRLKADKKKKTA